MLLLGLSWSMGADYSQQHLVLAHVDNTQRRAPRRVEPRYVLLLVSMLDDDIHQDQGFNKFIHSSSFSVFSIHSSSFLLASVCSVLLPVPTGQDVCLLVCLSVCLFASLSVSLSVRLSRPLAAVWGVGGVGSFRDRFSAEAVPVAPPTSQSVFRFFRDTSSRGRSHLHTQTFHRLLFFQFFVQRHRC